MRWQRRLRVAIALFVVVFAAFLVVSLRRGRRPAPPPTLDIKSQTATMISQKGHYSNEEKGKQTFAIDFGNSATYADGRTTFGGGVKVVLPDKEGRRITIASQNAEVKQPPGKQLGNATFTGGVTLTTSDGITVQADTATYSDDDQTARVPGKVAFTRGRMSGTATGATYDQNREILWLLQDAIVEVQPDPTGSGAVHVTANAAGM